MATTTFNQQGKFGKVESALIAANVSQIYAVLTQILIDMENLNNVEKFSDGTQTELRISDVIQRFIQNEREQLEVKRKYYLTKKGDYSFHNLNSIQGQLSVLDRLDGVVKNVV